MKPTPLLHDLHFALHIKQAPLVPNNLHSRDNPSQLPSSKFNMPILCAQSLRLPSSKFQYFSLNHCACHPPNLRANTLHSISAPEFERSIFTLNHCGCRPPSLKGRKKKRTPQKAIWEDEIFEKQWLLSAQCARKKAANVELARGCPFHFLTNLTGPVWQTDVSGTGCLQIWRFFTPPPRPQAVFREQFLPIWALTGAQRRRQSFREQFFAHLGFNWGLAPPPGSLWGTFGPPGLKSLGSNFGPTSASTGFARGWWRLLAFLVLSLPFASCMR